METIALADRPPPPSADLAEIVGWIEDHWEQLGRAATDNIFAAVPAYAASASPGLWDDLRRHYGQVLRTAIDLLGAARPPADSDFGYSVGRSAERFRAGITVSDILHAYRIGQLTLFDRVRELCRERPHLYEASLDLITHVMNVNERASTVAAHAYMVAEQDKLADDDRTARDLLEDLLAGRPLDDSGRRLSLGAVGLAGDEPVAVVVVTTPGREPMSGPVVRSLRAALRRSLGGLVVVRSTDVVAVVNTRRRPRADVVRTLERVVETMASHRASVSVGLGSAFPSPAGTVSSYEEALVALSVLGTESGLRAFEDVSLVDYLVRAGDERVMRIVGDRLTAFLRQDAEHGGESLRTARAYAEHRMNARATGAALHMHTNTVHYRLDGVRERTGLDLRVVPDLMEFLLAGALVAEHDRPERDGRA